MNFAKFQRTPFSYRTPPVTFESGIFEVCERKLTHNACVVTCIISLSNTAVSQDGKHDY